MLSPSCHEPLTPVQAAHPESMPTRQNPRSHSEVGFPSTFSRRADIPSICRSMNSCARTDEFEKMLETHILKDNLHFN
eukprot:SAG31_NODE_1600_length_7791_cov_15.201508_7_plen_78_part_00